LMPKIDGISFIDVGLKWRTKLRMRFNAHK
jgi:hypothetical protein